MREQHIRFFERVPLPRQRVEHKDSYHVRNDRPLVWLQEVCCWAMRKLGAYREDNSTLQEYMYKDVDISNLVEGIYTQLGLLESDYNIRGKRVLMGSEEFAQLCKAPEARYNLTVYAPSLQFGGLTVTVIPWMKGVLVLPE